ncbi:DUF294 nucleotidyltransferase-like domain-containing protein [Vibrio alfacsensis]|uniref:DUF294 nucleotidyltransferase-like domain-containing protein n=1 Tax=Vibrio alfacsensis TaxID=1074311 RepID=UPI002ADD3F27|nr:DUF294 nucleotidyltransferase-like domain-containing protein [Vibrio alfacsensis]WQE77886.1 DUF294 nucleotidyltransferase-like domain-containing protein [Vibrio alfacsensis]
MAETLFPNITHFLSKIDPFSQLPEYLTGQIASKVKIVHYSENQYINTTNNTEKLIYIICKGAIEQREHDGTLRSRLGKEDIFGFSLIDDKNVSPYTARAITSTLLYVIRYEEILNTLSGYPNYAAMFAIQAENRLNSALNVVWSDEKGLFIRKVSDVASTRVSIVSPQTAIQDVAIDMHQHARAPCSVITDGDCIVGIMTDRDMTRRVVACNKDVRLPVSEVMTHHPVTVSPSTLVLDAVALMMSKDIRNLPVVKDGKVEGLLTTSDLVHNHRMQAVFLIQKIRYSKSLEELSAFKIERQAVFEALVDGNVTSASTGKVMSLIMDAYTKRLIQLFLSEQGQPPCDFAWIVAGSHARNELHLLSDQDSALVFSDDVDIKGQEYFQRMAKFVCEGLDDCGYPLCSGNYMATNHRWCQPISMWKHYYRKWTKNPEYERLLNITVFLEIRSVYGRHDYVNELRHCLYESIAKNREFILMLVREATKTTPPLGIFNSLVLERTGENVNTLDIKKYAVNLIIDLARVYGLMAHCEELDTEARFKSAWKKGLLSEVAYKDITSAFRFILSYRLYHQLECLKSGRVLNNNINPDVFGSFERKHLKDAFRLISKLQNVAKLRVGLR